MAEARSVAAVIRRVFERLNEGDIDGFVELCSPRVEWHEIPEIPGARAYRGPDEVREWASNLLEVSDRIRFVNWEMSERGNAALVDTSVEMPSASDVDLGWRAWTVWRVREDLVAYYAGYSEREAALADFESKRGEVATERRHRGSHLRAPRSPRRSRGRRPWRR